MAVRGGSLGNIQCRKDLDGVVLLIAGSDKCKVILWEIVDVRFVKIWLKGVGVLEK